MTVIRYDDLKELVSLLRKAMEAAQAFQYERSPSSWGKLQNHVRRAFFLNLFRLQYPLDDSLERSMQQLWRFENECAGPTYSELNQLKKDLHLAYRLVDERLMEIEDMREEQ